MTRTSRNVPALLLAVLLTACLIAYQLTRESGSAADRHPQTAADAEVPVDTSLLQTAVKLAPFAATAGEQDQAREAWRLADHELDLNYAEALREAAEAAQPATARSRRTDQRIAALKQRVEADKKRVAGLAANEGDDLDRAQAQLDLDQDELDDAQEDSARESGGKHAQLQRLLQQHEASDKVADQGLKFGAPAPDVTLRQQVRTWFSLAGYARQLKDAAQESAVHARSLLDRHNVLQHQFSAEQNDTEAASTARLRQLSTHQKTLTGLDQRIQDSQQLVRTYQRWSRLVQVRKQAVLNLMLRSFAIVLGILLGAVLLIHTIRYRFHQADKRRLYQLRVIVRLAIQIVTVAVILIVVFGLPTQLSTMIGLLTAGLTVALKDFIVSFFGWFMLLGKNGMSVGDWVEIEGVSGEVVEIGLLRTVLLELGNWTDAGHPTGRRVAFSNSFALERHYFNFSTSGQWLWDELQFLVPDTSDPYETAQKIREVVERETQADADEAAKEWQRVAHQYGAREFSATPAVHLKPGVNGLEAVVRYIARAPHRNAVRAKLFQSIVALLRKPARENTI